MARLRRKLFGRGEKPTLTHVLVSIVLILCIIVIGIALDKQSRIRDVVILRKHRIQDPTDSWDWQTNY